MFRTLILQKASARLHSACKDLTHITHWMQHRMQLQLVPNMPARTPQPYNSFWCIVLLRRLPQMAACWLTGGPTPAARQVLWVGKLQNWFESYGKGCYQQGPRLVDMLLKKFNWFFGILCKQILFQNLICLTTGKYGRRKLPILGWLPQYCTDWAVADMIAGVTVGLTIIPQVMEGGLLISLLSSSLASSVS